MSDFNIKKFLAESERLSYADFTSGQRRRKPQTPSSELTGFEPQFQPSPCTACDGTGRQPKRGHYSNDPCIHCDGKGELVEGYDDYEGWNDNAGEFEPAINMCPSCEGEGCEECGGEGAIHEDTVSEGNADEMAREVAQDMIDSGFAAVSDANFDEMYETFMDRYREGWGWPDSFREDVRAAYKAILKKKAMSGSDFNEDADLGKMLENAGIAVETKDQGAAPGAQLKGKQGIKKGGVKGYDDDHPASGRLVGESDDVGNWHDHDRNDNYDDDPLDDMTEFGDEDAEFFGYDPRDDDPWAMGSDKEDIGAKYRKSDDNPFGTEGNGYDDAQLDKYDTEHGLVDPFGLEEELLAEYGEDEFDRDEEDEYEMYGEPEDEPRGPFIDGEYTRRSYWNKNGGYQKASDKLQDLIPAMGEVEDAANNPALENFRSMGNVYYDVHNNGGYGIGEGYGQRYEEMVAITGWDENEIYSYEELENAVDDVVEAAWFEQLAKGTVSDTDIDVEENFSGAFATGPMVQEDEDDDFIGKGEMDMGSDTIVGPGDLVQVDSSLGGEATVVAQRAGYIVVNLPKGGMKLLRDDEWWIDDEDGGGMDDGYVDVDYDDEEPEELAFEGGKDFWTDVGDTLNRDGTVQGLAGRQLKRAGKSMKRGLKGWGGYSKPADMVKKHQGYSDEELKSLQRMPSDIKGTPAALQQKLVKRNLRKRGYRDFEKHMDEDQAAVMPQHSQDDRQDPLFREGYKILPPMDPKYIERDGLEGPFPTRSGKVVYYDPKEGKYYDPDTDIYMSNDEYAEYDRDPDMEYPEFSAGNTDTPRRERGRMDEFTQEQRLLKHFNTSYGKEHGLQAQYDDKSKTFSVGQHNDEYGQGAEIWSGNADEFGSKYNIKNRYGIEEAGEWYGGPSRRMQQKMHSELGHENSWNNYAIFIDGKHWKTVKGSQHAQAIVRTLQKKGKNAEWKYGAYPMSESSVGDIVQRNNDEVAADPELQKRFGWNTDGEHLDGDDELDESSNFKKGWKKKGGGYNKPGSKAGKKSSSKAQRKDDKKAITAEGSAHDESWLPKTWARKTDESLTDGQGSKTRTYTGDLATTEVEPPYGGFSRLGMKDLAEWIKLRKDHPRWAEMVKKAKKVLAAKKSKAKFMKGKRPTATKYKYTIAKQVGGDDGYQWAVIDKQANRIMVSGLTKPEVKHYRDRAERDLAAKYEASLQHELEPGEEVLDELFDDQLSEIETASDQLDQDRDVGEPTELAGTAADSDAELAGMQQIMKNMLNEPDQDMEDAIQKMAIADPDQEEVSLDNDELAQLQQLLGLLK